MKGVSIPINTLVMLAVAIIVLLAAVAWFMGAFSPTAQQSTLKQKFDSSCLLWARTNCEPNSLDEDVCQAYVQLHQPAGFDCAALTDSEIQTIAQACGCMSPYGIQTT